LAAIPLQRFVNKLKGDEQLGRGEVERE
jgi:hypothetical protein